MMRRFKRIDLTNATEDYFLKVGEEAYISFSNVTQVPLHIATQDGTYYEMHIIPSNTGGTTGGVSANYELYPNNTTYTNQFVFAEFYRISTVLNSVYATGSHFPLGAYYATPTAWITNRANYKNVRVVWSTYGVNSAWPYILVASTDWRDTTTPWESLGTIKFPQSTSGEILVRRLR